ncbi:MAG: SOS response-associated peptidase [Actinomycetota bacterium]|nr:SOS response-associated peptidase [Actinomycetota bacterium]
MCGRFALDEKTNDLISLFVADGNDYEDWVPSFSIAPTDPVPIIRERRDKVTGEVRRTIDRAVWNFHPSFMKDAKRPQFNSRIETVATNGLWKGAFMSSRCIVPMRGYFEWTEREDTRKIVKIPHFIHGPERVLAAAGIWTARQVAKDWELSTSIITREARDASGELHDRMPVFLEPGVFDRWLDTEKLTDDAQTADVLTMLDHVSGEVASTITTYEVDRKINNSRTVDPADVSLIAPVG